MTPMSSRPHGVMASDAERRRPGALADAMTRGWRPYRWRGYAVGVVAGIALGGIVAPILTTSVVIGLALAGITVDPRVPWAEVVWSVTFVVTFAAVGAWAVARWLPAAFRDALESYVWIARRAETQWRHAFGDRPVPRSQSALRDFVEATPETAETAGERVAAWLALGDVDAARRCVSQMTTDTPTARYARDGSAWLVEFVGGSTGDLVPLREGAAEIEDPDDRLAAEVELAANTARIELAAGRDWRPPLASGARAPRRGTERAPLAACLAVDVPGHARCGGHRRRRVLGRVGDRLTAVAVSRPRCRAGCRHRSAAPR